MSPTEADATRWADYTARKYNWHSQADEIQVVAQHAALQALAKYHGQPYRRHRNAIIGAVLKRIASFMRGHENLYRTHTRAGIPIPEMHSVEEWWDSGTWNPPTADFAPGLLEEIEVERKLGLLTRNLWDRELLRRTVLEGESVAELAREWGMTRFALQKRREEALRWAKERWEATG
jgi:hypothetical protein